MRGELRSRRSGLLSSFVRRAGFGLLVAAGLIGAAQIASAQTFPNLSGTWPTSSTISPAPPGLPSAFSTSTIYHQASPGGGIVGTTTNYWPGTPYTATYYLSGTISGSTLTTTSTLIPSTVVMPSGTTAGGGGTGNSTLSSTGGVTTASIPVSTYSSGGVTYTVAAHTATFVGWQKMYGTESDGCGNCGPEVFLGGSIDTSTGNVVDTATDYETAGPNKLSLVRYYNSYTAGSRLPPTYFYLVGNNVAHVTTNYDRGLTIAGSVATIYRPDGQQLTFKLVGTTWTPDADVDMTLVNTSGSTWKLTNHDDTVETYTVSGGTGQLNSIKSRNGYTQTLAYNGSNQLATVTDSYSRTLTFTYSGGYLATVTTPDSLVLTYNYSSSTGGANDRIASVIYNTSPATNLTYNYTNASFPLNITSVTDENGNSFRSWTYDTYGRALTDQTGTGTNANVTTVAYNDAAGTSTVTNALSQPTTTTYTAFQGGNRPMVVSRTATATVPAASESYAYDSNGFLATAIDWDAVKTVYTNDAHGDPTTIVEASGNAVTRTTTIAYDPTFVHLPDTITTTGLTTGFTYDGSGNPLTQTLTDTTTQTIPYSTNGQTRTTHFTWSNFLPLTVQTPNGNTTTFTFGTDGALTNIQNALLQNTAITSHTGGGLPLTIVDPNSVTTTLTYSPRNWLTTSTVSTGAGPLTTTNTYDQAGELIKVQQPDGSYLVNAYDTAHRLTTVTDSFGNSINYTLDSLGDRTASNIENPSAVVTRGHTATYDSLGRALKDIGGMSQTTNYSYNNDGDVLDFDPPGQSFIYANDQLFRAFRMQFGSIFGFVTKSFDTHDRTLTAEDQLSHTTSFVYDGFGEAIQVASPDTGTAVYHYDSDGNLTQKVDAASITTNYTYDALDRALTTTYPADTSENVAYTYDQTGTGFTFGIGRLTSLTDMAGSLTRTYDERGNLLSEQRVNGATTLTTGYTYDAASRVLTITYPDGSLLTYTRDAMGRVTAVSDKPSGAGSPTTLASSVTYEPFGPWAGLTYGNSVTETPTWDLDYRLTTLIDTGTAAVQHIGYTYAASDQPTAFTDSLTSTNSVTSIGVNGLFNINTYSQSTNHWTPGYDNGSDAQNGATARRSTRTPPTLVSGSNRYASVKVGTVTTTISTNANGNITGFSPAYGTPARGNFRSPRSPITTPTGSPL